LKITDEDWAVVVRALEIVKTQSERLGKATDQLGIDVESPLRACFYSVSECVIDLLESRLDIAFDTLSWWTLECRYGETPLQAGKEGNMRSIKNTDDLRWLIELEAESDVET